MEVNVVGNAKQRGVESILDKEEQEGKKSTLVLVEPKLLTRIHRTHKFNEN